MTPPKPRRYDGPVPFILQAQARAAGWPTPVLEAVMAAFPYPKERKVRMKDWLAVVAHVADGHGEDPVTCAERLAKYATAWAEANQTAPPLPSTIQRTQDARLTEENQP